MNNRKAPRIRFKGYTDDWEQRKLGDIVGIYDGVHQTPNYQNSGVMFLSVENIATLKSSKFISEEDFKRDYKVFPQEKDILMTRIGDVGTTNVVTDNGLKAYYVSLALLKYKSTDPYFLSNAVQSDYVQKGLANRTLKTAIPMKINKDEIGKVSVMLPLSATEQQQIGTYFRNLDHLITLHQRKLEKLKIVKKAMLENCFPKNGEKVPKFRFSGFSGDWEQRKVSEIFKITRGYVLAATETADIKDDKNCYPVYSSQTKNEGLMGFYSEYLYENAITWTTDGANAGTVRYRSGKFYCTNVCGVLLSEEGYANKAVSEALNSVAWKYVSHVGNPKLMNNVMADIEIVIPKLVKEQETISRYFDEIDHLITLHQRKLEKLKIIKKSFLEKMFV